MSTDNFEKLAVMVNIDLALATSILPSSFGPYHLLYVVRIGSL